MDRSHKIIMLLAFVMIISVAASVATAQYDVNISDNTTSQWVENIPAIGGFIASLGFMVCCLVFVVPLIVSVLLCIWIYKDAEERGEEGVLWVLLLLLATFFLNIIGLLFVLILWLAVRPKQR